MDSIIDTYAWNDGPLFQQIDTQNTSQNVPSVKLFSPE
jgi:hypothetical protein